VLKALAVGLGSVTSDPGLIAGAIGAVSALIDNVPLVAATQGMYSLADVPVDSQLWQQVALCAGTTWGAGAVCCVAPKPVATRRRAGGAPCPGCHASPVCCRRPGVWRAAALTALDPPRPRAGTGGSLLVIGSASGIAFLGLEEGVTFGWVPSRGGGGAELHCWRVARVARGGGKGACLADCRPRCVGRRGRAGCLRACAALTAGFWCAGPAAAAPRRWYLRRVTPFAAAGYLSGMLLYAAMHSSWLGGG